MVIYSVVSLKFVLEIHAKGSLTDNSYSMRKVRRAVPFYFYQFSCIFQEKKNYQSSLASRVVEGNEDFEKNMQDC